MKNGITILLLINFLVFQYARQFSYWECRLSNYFQAENEKCDCEKLVKTFAGQSQSSQPPVTHHHFHVDESFYPSSIEETQPSYASLASPFTIGHSFLSMEMTSGIDHPPQVRLHSIT